MKNKLLILVFLMVSLFSYGQPTNYTRVDARYNWLSGYFRALTAPAGQTVGLASGQWPGAGALYVDTLGTDSGFYYRGENGVFHKIAKHTSLDAYVLIADTANKWVGGIYRTAGKDSIFFQIGSTTYAIKDSTGGASQALQQVLDVGSTLTSSETITVDANLLTILGSSTTSVLSAVLDARLNNTNTNTIDEVLRLTKTTTGTAANGIGAELSFWVENAIGSVDENNALQSVLTNATSGQRTSSFRILGFNVGVSETFLDVQPEYVIADNGADTLADRAYARSVGGSGSGVTDGDKGDVTVSASGATYTVDNDVFNSGRGLTKASGVVNNAASYRSQVSHADQSSSIPSLIWQRTSEATEDVWRDGALTFDINDTLFVVGGYHLFATGLNTDSIYYSVNGGQTFTLYDVRFPTTIANCPIIQARFPGDWNYVIGASFPETNTKRKTVYRFKHLHEITSMTTNAEWGVRSGQGAGTDEDGNIYVFGGATSTDTTTALQDVWMSTAASGGAVWTQIQTGLTWMGGELIDNVVYRDGYFYIVNANNKYGNGTNAYGWKNYKIGSQELKAGDETKWVRLDDSPAGVTRQIFLSTQLHRGLIWATSGYNIASSNTDSIAYLDKNDKWHAFHNYIGIHKTPSTPNKLSTAHATALVEHRGSLYRVMGSGTNDTYILKDTSYLAPFFAREYVGTGRRTYMSEGISGQGSIWGNGVVANPDANNQIIRKTSEDGIYMRQRYDIGTQFGVLTGSNSTQNVGVASGTGYVGGVDASGIWRLGDDASYNPGSWGGLLRVKGGMYLSGLLRAPGLTTALIDTTTYKPLVYDADGDVIQMTHWPASGGGGSGTINSGTSGDIPIYTASTTLDNTAPLRWDDDGTNLHMTVGSGSGKWQIGSRVSGSGIPGLWPGNITPSFTNYAFLYDVNSGSIFNAPTNQAIQMRIANTNFLWLDADGGLSFGPNNYNTSPGAGGNMTIEGKLGIGKAGTPTSMFNVGSSEDFQISSAGKIKDYANAAPTDGQILIGHTANATFEKGTIGSTGGSITVTNGAGTINLETVKAYATYTLNTDKTFATGGVADSIQLDTEDLESGITHSTASATDEITFPTAGIYTFNWTAHAQSASNHALKVGIQKWNGSAWANVANTSSIITVEASGTISGSGEFQLSLSANDKIRFVGSVTNTALTLNAIAAADGVAEVPAFRVTIHRL